MSPLVLSYHTMTVIMVVVTRFPTSFLLVFDPLLLLVILFPVCSGFPFPSNGCEFGKVFLSVTLSLLLVAGVRPSSTIGASVPYVLVFPSLFLPTTVDFVGFSTLAYPNFFGTKRLCCC